jgi:hypothetical protein
MGSKEIGERVQYSIDDMHHGQRPIPKGLSKTCQYHYWPSFLSYSLMHVLDCILGRLSRLFRFNNYSLVEKACFILLV